MAQRARDGMEARVRNAEMAIRTAQERAEKAEAMMEEMRHALMNTSTELRRFQELEVTRNQGENQESQVGGAADLNTQRMEMLDELTQALKKQRYIGNPKLEFSTTTTLFAMLKANIGVTVLPTLAIPCDDDLVSLPMIDPVETRELCVILRQDWTLSPAADAMVEVLSQQMPALARQFKLTAKSG